MPENGTSLWTAVKNGVRERTTGQPTLMSTLQARTKKFDAVLNDLRKAASDDPHFRTVITELQRLAQQFPSRIENLLYWCEDLYRPMIQYVDAYAYYDETEDSRLQKAPFVYIEDMRELLQAGESELSMSLGLARLTVISSTARRMLTIRASRHNSNQIDFGSVHSFETGKPVSAAFDTIDIMDRAIFDMAIVSPGHKTFTTMAELILLQNGGQQSLAICQIKRDGQRSLMFPSFRGPDFTLTSFEDPAGLLLRHPRRTVHLTAAPYVINKWAALLNGHFTVQPAPPSTFGSFGSFGSFGAADGMDASGLGISCSSDDEQSADASTNAGTKTASARTAALRGFEALKRVSLGPRLDFAETLDDLLPQLDEEITTAAAAAVAAPSSVGPPTQQPWVAASKQAAASAPNLAPPRLDAPPTAAAANVLPSPAAPFFKGTATPGAEPSPVFSTASTESPRLLSKTLTEAESARRRIEARMQAREERDHAARYGGTPSMAPNGGILPAVPTLEARRAPHAASQAASQSAPDLSFGTSASSTKWSEPRELQSDESSGSLSSLAHFAGAVPAATTKTKAAAAAAAAAVGPPPQMPLPRPASASPRPAPDSAPMRPLVARRPPPVQVQVATPQRSSLFAGDALPREQAAADLSVVPISPVLGPDGAAAAPLPEPRVSFLLNSTVSPAPSVGDAPGGAPARPAPAPVFDTPFLRSFNEPTQPLRRNVVSMYSPQLEQLGEPAAEPAEHPVEDEARPLPVPRTNLEARRAKTLSSPDLLRHHTMSPPMFFYEDEKVRSTPSLALKGLKRFFKRGKGKQRAASTTSLSAAREDDADGDDEKEPEEADLIDSPVLSVSTPALESARAERVEVAKAVHLGAPAGPAVAETAPAAVLGLGLNLASADLGNGDDDEEEEVVHISSAPAFVAAPAPVALAATPATAPAPTAEAGLSVSSSQRSALSRPINRIYRSTSSDKSLASKASGLSAQSSASAATLAPAVEAKDDNLDKDSESVLAPRGKRDTFDFSDVMGHQKMGSVATAVSTESNNRTVVASSQFSSAHSLSRTVKSVRSAAPSSNQASISSVESVTTAQTSVGSTDAWNRFLHGVKSEASKEINRVEVARKLQHEEESRVATVIEVSESPVLARAEETSRAATPTVATVAAAAAAAAAPAPATDGPASAVDRAPKSILATSVVAPEERVSLDPGLDDADINRSQPILRKMYEEKAAADPEQLTREVPKFFQNQNDSAVRQVRVVNPAARVAFKEDSVLSMFTGRLWVSKWANGRWTPLSQLELEVEVRMLNHGGRIVVYTGSGEAEVLKFQRSSKVRRSGAHDIEVRLRKEVFMMRSRSQNEAHKFYAALGALKLDLDDPSTWSQTRDSGSDTTSLSTFSSSSDSADRRGTLTPPMLGRGRNRGGNRSTPSSAPASRCGTPVTIHKE